MPFLDASLGCRSRVPLGVPFSGAVLRCCSRVPFRVPFSSAVFGCQKGALFGCHFRMLFLDAKMRVLLALKFGPANCQCCLRTATVLNMRQFQNMEFFSVNLAAPKLSKL